MNGLCYAVKASLCVTLAGMVGCGALSSRGSNDDEAPALATVDSQFEAHFARGVDLTPATGDAVRGLRRAIQQAGQRGQSGRTATLRRLRAEVLFDLYLVYRLRGPSDVEGAEAANEWFDLLVGSTPQSVEFVGELSNSIESDLLAGGIPSPIPELARVSVATPNDLSEPERELADADPWLGPRLRLRGLADIAEFVRPWSAQGSEELGADAIARCGVACGVAGSNFRDMAVSAGLRCDALTQSPGWNGTDSHVDTRIDTHTDNDVESELQPGDDPVQSGVVSDGVGNGDAATPNILVPLPVDHIDGEDDDEFAPGIEQSDPLIEYDDIDAMSDDDDEPVRDDDDDDETEEPPPFYNGQAWFYESGDTEMWTMLEACGPASVAVPETQFRSPFLACAENYVDAHLLSALRERVDAINTDLSHNVRVTMNLAFEVELLRSTIAEAVIPQHVPPRALDGDLTLRIPRSFISIPDSIHGRVARSPELRVVVVRSDGVRLAMRPHLALGEAGELYYAENAAGYHLPGAEVLAFDGPGRIPNNGLDDDQEVPALREALADFEDAIASMSWVSDDDRTAQPAMSILCDASTYYASLRPVIATLRSAGYGHLVLHADHAATDAMTAVPVMFALDAESPAHLLIVREDGYFIQPYDPNDLSEPILVSRVSRGPLLELYRALETGLWNDTLDPSLPLHIRVDDGSVDFGILSHLITGLAYQRNVGEAATDADFLRSTLTEQDGLPVGLVPAGLFLRLE